MKRIWLGAAIALIIAGLGTIACALMISGFDLKQFSGDPYETKTYEITEMFFDININTTSADIEFKKAEDGIARVVCKENENCTYTVKAEGRVLQIISHDKRKWYHFFTLDFEKKTMTVYLPEQQYFKLYLGVSTGDVDIPEGFRFRSVDITGSTGHVDVSLGETESVSISRSSGDIRLTNTRAQKVKIETSTGHVNLDSVIAEKEMKIETSTGDVKLKGCDSPKISIETSTGDVTGELLSKKHFQTETSTGKVVVPGDESDEICEIKTSTGDIKMSVK